MRYRKLTSSGDYQFGAGSSFLVNTPETVAQAIRTRLQLMKGEWFLDNTIGLDKDAILGYGTQPTRDFEIQQLIIGTEGVTEITIYNSAINGRAFTVTATVNTLYGVATIKETL